MSRKIVVALAVLIACGAEPSKPAPTPVPPPVGSVAVVPVAPPAASSATPPALPPKPWDIARAPRIAVNDKARGTIGDKPTKPPKLREVERSPGYGAERPPPLPTALPMSTSEMPVQIDGADRRTLSVSNGKILTTYGAKVLLVGNANTGGVEQLLMMDSPELPLSANERDTDNLGTVAYSEGTVFLCREWNGKNPKTARRIDAIDVATGSRRWISAPETCDDIRAIGDYVVATRNSSLKLLRRYDGVVALSVGLPGRLPWLRVEDDRIVIETTTVNLAYELQ